MEDDGGQYGTQITDIGWFRDATVDGGGISVSPDGLVWQEIPIDLDEMAGAGGGGVTVLGRTIFASTYEVGGEHQMWVGRVADG